MKSKPKVLWTILAFIFLIVFNSVVFLAIKEFTTAFWVAYVFIHFSYLCLVFSFITFPKARGAVVIGYPLIYIALYYFITTFLVGMIFIIYKHASLNFALIPQIIITGLFLFKYVSHLLINEKTIRSESEDRAETFFIKKLAFDVKEMLAEETNLDMKKKIEKLYDAINCSQINSTNEAADIEKAIEIKYKELKQSYQADISNFEKTLNELHELIAKRDKVISLIAMQ